jgi:predicted MFS family arabinose efflux permease
MWRDPRLVVLLLAGSLIVMAGGVIAPILPALIADLNIDPSVGSSLVSLHFLTVAIATPILGILADRYSALFILMVSLVAFAGFGIAGGWMQSLVPLIVLRGGLGVASGGIAAAGLGLLSKLYSGERRTQAIAYVASTLTLANIIYPLLGGWLGSIHWRLAFAAYGISIPLSLWVLVVFKTDATPHERVEDGASSPALGDPRQVVQMLTNPFTLQLLLTLSLASGTVYAVVAYLPLYLQATLDLGTTVSGAILAVQAVGAVVSSALGMRYLVKRLSGMGAIALGLGVMAVMLFLFPRSANLYSLFSLSIAFGLGFGVVVPSLYNELANLAREEMQSSILAAGTGAGFLGQFLSPILLGLVLRNSDLQAVFYVAAVGDLVAGFLLIFLNQKATNTH